VSQPDLRSVSPGRRPYGEKQRADIYTVLLILALLAILVSCLFLFLEIKYQRPNQRFFDPMTSAQPRGDAGWSVAGVPGRQTLHESRTSHHAHQHTLRSL
jgi:hypothetical protein